MSEGYFAQTRSFRPARVSLPRGKPQGSETRVTDAPARMALAALLAAHVSSAAADETLQPIPALPPISIGVGLQTSLYDCDKRCIYSPSAVPAGDNSVQGIAVDSIRLYIDGSVTDTLKLTFNTEYTGSGSGPEDNKVEVMDAIGRLEYNTI